MSTNAKNNSKEIKLPDTIFQVSTKSKLKSKTKTKAQNKLTSTKKSKKNIDNSDDSSSSSSSSNNKSKRKQRRNSDDEELIKIEDFTTKEKDFYNILDNFYSSLTDDELKTIYNIVTEKSISLRRFEWFAVRYSYFYKTSINVNNRFLENRVFVHISYKAHLKTYHKKFFDIFRRSDKEKKTRKFEFSVKNKNFTITTSISQLHVMRWMLTHGIIDYVVNNYDKIMEKEDEVDLYFKNKSERSKSAKKSKIIKNYDDSTNGSGSKSGSIVVNRKIQFEV